jgi:DNA-binding response OmpR family regulator
MQRKAEIPFLRVGNLEVDAVRHRATRAGAKLKLTPKEFELLKFLAKHVPVARSPTSKFSWPARRQ